MKETWKDIDGYVGLYQVSTYGNVKSIARTVKRCDGNMNLKVVIIKRHLGTSGYLQVSLSKNGIVKGHLVHRLVAKEFLKCNDGMKEVNHINETKIDNHVENLEWVTPKQNSNYGTGIERRVSNSNFKGENNPMFGITGSKNKRSIPIVQYDLSGNKIREFASASCANRKLGYNASSIIGVARGRCKQAYGFVWKYKQSF